MTINERAPEDGDTSFARVSPRLDMSLQEAMETQRAVRKVLPDPVDDAIVLRCIELALRAPTSSNGQNWQFVVVKDRETKEYFAKQYRRAWKLYGGIGQRLVTGDPAMQKVLGAVSWQVEHFTEIPVVVVPCLQSGRTASGSRALRLPSIVPQPELSASSHFGAIYPSTQNLLLAARAMGLGASLITLPLWSTRGARRALGLPRSVTPVCMVPLGWPRGRYGPTTRLPVADVVHLDRYGSPFP